MIINGKEFKAVPGYTGYYASEDGEIYSNKYNGKILSQRILGCVNYKSVGLTIDGKLHNVPVHRMVALAWCPLPKGYTPEEVLGAYLSRDLVVHHMNKNKLDNRASNLMWITQYDHINNEHSQEERSKKMMGNQNAKNRKQKSNDTYRHTYYYNGKAYGLSELARELNCSKSKITESFRRNLGLVKQGKLTRDSYKKGA